MIPPPLPQGVQVLSTCPQNNIAKHDSAFGHIMDEASSWQKNPHDQSRCYHDNSLTRLPSLTEEQRVQQYQNNQHLNVEGWPLLPPAQPSQSQFMTLGRRNTSQLQHHCNRNQANQQLTTLLRWVITKQPAVYKNNRIYLNQCRLFLLQGIYYGSNLFDY